MQAAFLTNAQIPVDMESLAIVTLSRTTLHNKYLVELKTDNIVEVMEEIIGSGVHVFLTCNKGALKKSNTHFVKILCWHSTKTSSINMFNMDFKDTDGTLKNCADTLEHSLKQFFK